MKFSNICPTTTLYVFPLRLNPDRMFNPEGSVTLLCKIGPQPGHRQGDPLQTTESESAFLQDFPDNLCAHSSLRGLALIPH